MKMSRSSNDRDRAMNRTGLATAPGHASELLDATSSTAPSARGDESGIAAVRMIYARQAEPPGTLAPAGRKELPRGRMKPVSGPRAMVFVDKLGERLAFERSGTRLYQALISKFDAFGTWAGGPARADLMEIHDQERQHFLMLNAALETLGADPTALTPSADLSGVASSGVLTVLTDFRTDLRQGMEAILIAELVDNDCWENLADLARTLGQHPLADQFERALADERKHLTLVREWIAAALAHDAAGLIAEIVPNARNGRGRRPGRRGRGAPAGATARGTRRPRSRA